MPKFEGDGDESDRAAGEAATHHSCLYFSMNSGLTWWSIDRDGDRMA